MDIKSSEVRKHARISIPSNFKPEVQFESSRGGLELEQGHFDSPKISSYSEVNEVQNFTTTPEAFCLSLSSSLIKAARGERAVFQD